MATHDPLRFAAGLSAKLATRSRHVSAFLGAGAARACGLPDMDQLQERVLESLDGAQKTQFAGFLQRGNLEQALSRLRRIVALLEGDQVFDGLTELEARSLDTAVCQAIVSALDISGKDLSPMEHFAAWVARANYRLPLEVFTVNYDLLLETALESIWSAVLRRVCWNPTRPVSHGAGRERLWPGRRVDAGVPRTAMEATRIGELGRGQDKQIVRLGQPVAEGSAAAIYPSDTKYEESRRVPFVVLQDRFRRALHGPRRRSCSWRDTPWRCAPKRADVDRRRCGRRSEIVVFCYSDIPEVLANRAALTPNMQVVSGSEAILGGIRGKWRYQTVRPQVSG